MMMASSDTAPIEAEEDRELDHADRAEREEKVCRVYLRETRLSGKKVL